MPFSFPIDIYTYIILYVAKKCNTKVMKKRESCARKAKATSGISKKIPDAAD
jgi:hypothetical protein